MIGNDTGGKSDHSVKSVIMRQCASLVKGPGGIHWDCLRMSALVHRSHDSLRRRIEASANSETRLLGPCSAQRLSAPLYELSLRNTRDRVHFSMAISETLYLGTSVPCFVPPEFFLAHEPRLLPSIPSTSSYFTPNPFIGTLVFPSALEAIISE